MIESTPPLNLLFSQPEEIKEYLMSVKETHGSLSRHLDYDAILINFAQKIQEQGEIIAELKLLLDRVESLLGGGIR